MNYSFIKNEREITGLCFPSGVISRHPLLFPYLKKHLTSSVVEEYFSHLIQPGVNNAVTRWADGRCVFVCDSLKPPPCMFSSSSLFYLLTPISSVWKTCFKFQDHDKFDSSIFFILDSFLLVQHFLLYWNTDFCLLDCVEYLWLSHFFVSPTKASFNLLILFKV